MARPRPLGGPSAGPSAYRLNDPRSLIIRDYLKYGDRWKRLKKYSEDTNQSFHLR